MAHDKSLAMALEISRRSKMKKMAMGGAVESTNKMSKEDAMAIARTIMDKHAPTVTESEPPQEWNDQDFLSDEEQDEPVDLHMPDDPEREVEGTGSQDPSKDHLGKIMSDLRKKRMMK